MMVISKEKLKYLSLLFDKESYVNRKSKLLPNIKLSIDTSITDGVYQWIYVGRNNRHEIDNIFLVNDFEYLGFILFLDINK